MIAGPPPPPRRAAPPRRTFAYAVTGDAHVAQVNTSLAFLKRVTRADIVVVVARATAPVDHDQVLRATPPAGTTDHQAAILLKTGLHRLVGARGRTCYLDSDTVAVSPDVDDVFAAPGPIAFAADHVRLDRFSKWAVRCGCAALDCDHLRLAALDTFGVAITDRRWQHWNGGVFVFDADGAALLDRWTGFQLIAMHDPYWICRDQGTLAAAAWSLGWQGLPTLPRRYNHIVDRFRGIPPERRAGLAPHQLTVHDYDLRAPGGPALLHFLNGGMGVRGWKNWDEVADLAAVRAA